VTPDSHPRQYRHHIINRGTEMDDLEKQEKLRGQNKNLVVEVSLDNMEALQLIKKKN
jgi:hypothetical protein